MKPLVTLLKALGDETRLRLLALVRDDERCVCDLTAATGLPQSTVSRHLGLLRRAGLLADRKAGVWTYYRLADPGQALDPSFVRMLMDHPSLTDRMRQDQANLREYRESGQRACS